MIIEKTKKLKGGYEQLLTFETNQGGYEWFGDAPDMRHSQHTVSCSSMK